MKAFLEEYGAIIVTTLAALILLGLIGLLITPGNPIHDAASNLLMSSMP